MNDPDYVERDQRDRVHDVRIAALVQAMPSEQVHLTDLPYRLSSWASSSTPALGRLWLTRAGHLHAWACLQTPFWSVDIAIHPDAPASLRDTVLGWVDDRARSATSTPSGRLMWFAYAFADQTDVIAALETAGFENTGFVSQATEPAPWSMVLMRHSTERAAPAPRLPSGFTLRPLAGTSEVAAYVDLHRTVFESDSMTVEWRARVLDHPAYDPELDLVVAGPDGGLAAFCIGWRSGTGPANRSSGQIEPLGVDPRYRRLGLGRALAGECVHRLHAGGAEDVYVETDSFRDSAFALYESLGFAVERTILVFRKDYPPTNSTLRNRASAAASADAPAAGSKQASS